MAEDWLGLNFGRAREPNSTVSLEGVFTWLRDKFRAEAVETDRLLEKTEIQEKEFAETFSRVKDIKGFKADIS